MADLSPLDRLLDVFLSPVNIELSVKNWNQRRTSDGRSPHDVVSITLNGQILPDKDITIEETGEKLSGLEFTFDLRCKENIFDSIAESRSKDDYAVGILNYHPPISSGDGVVDKAIGSVSGGGMVDRRSMREMFRAFVLPSSLRLRIWLVLKAAKTPSENVLTYVTDGYRTTYLWAGKSLVVDEIEIHIEQTNKNHDAESAVDESGKLSNKSVQQQSISGVLNSIEEIRKAILYSSFADNDD